jgi:CHAD domain-containing protein
MLAFHDTSGAPVRKGKWIEGALPNQPVSAAARRTLEVRLAVVWHYLPLAARRAEEDVEHVHQLRVASRRGVAAVEIFWDLLPPRRARWLRKRLKEIRRTAGEARDDDVLAARLEQWAKRHPAVNLVLKQVRRHRGKAQKPIRNVHRKLVKERFECGLSELLDRIRWRDKRRRREPCFADAARASLRAFAASFWQAADGDFDDIAALHEFRIAGKELRYAMEVFAAAFSPAFRQEQYPLVEKLQELLGTVNDHATAEARLKAWLEESDDEQLSAALKNLLAAERRALAKSRQQFLAWWTPARARSLRDGLQRHLGHGRAAC